MCFYCGDDIDQYGELRKHTKSHGVCTDRDRAIKLVKSRDSEVKIDVSDITCEICNESFVYFEEIVDHLIIKHQLGYDKDSDITITTYRLMDLKCVFCEQSCDNFSRLVKHMNHTHPINCFVCHDCDRKFNKKRDLESHIRTRHKKEYNCKKCPLSFPNNAALQKHKARDHISMCNVCFEPFSSDSKKLDHMKHSHFEKDSLECGFCQKKLSTKLALLNHAGKCNAQCKSDIVFYKEPEAESIDKKPTVAEIRSNIACIVNMSTALPFKYFMNKFRCFYCPKDFIECDDLKEHTVMEHPSCNSKLKCLRLRNREHGIKIKIDISYLSCKMCFEPMQDLDSLIHHLITEHKAQYDKSVDNNMQPFKLIRDNFACPFCVEVYRYFSTLLKHISTSHTENRNICSYCGMSFRTDPSLRAHITLRHKPNGHKCNVCEKDFTTRHALRDHLGNAHGSKVAKCQVCSERFTSQYAMQRHMINVHATGHKCSYCGKMFTKNSFMVNHIRRTHLKEKNVQCSVCFERFFDVHLLRMHTVKHVGERNFHCDICGKKFLWKKNLRGHMSSHIKNTNLQLQP
jgi:hypothetical protein